MNGEGMKAALRWLLAVAALANKTNRLANGYRVPVDAALLQP